MEPGGRQGEVTLSEANRLRVFALLLIMGAAWGGGLNLAKLAVGHGGHPIGLALWQASFAGVFLLALAILRGRPPRVTPPVLRFNLVCGVIGLAFPAVGLFWAARYLPAGVVSMAFATMPLFTYGLAALFRVERVEALRLMGVFAGFAAVALLVLPESALPGANLAPWVLLAMACSVSMSAENLYVAVRRPPGQDSLALSCGRQFSAALVLAPLAFAADAVVPLFVPWGPVQWAACGMAVASAGAYTIFLTVIRSSGAVFASQTAYVITLAGVLWGMVLFGERHSPYIWAALGLMLLGLVLVRPRRSRP
ncbi:MAG: DMT family transporter [Pseudomonadota bacterium]